MYKVNETRLTNSNPIVTVIVPAYNAENSIEKTLESICNQTYSAIEVIVINDGSTDDTAKILKRIEGQESRVRVLFQDNAGVSVARNKGLDEAKGEYILFVDADDWIDLNMIEVLVNVCESEQADVATCLLKEENEISDSITENVKINPRTYEGKEAAGLALLNVWAIYCKLFRRELIKDIRLENFKVAEDVLFNTNVIAETDFHKLVEVPKAFYHYYIHDGSVMTAKTLDRKFLDAMYVEEQCLQKLNAISPVFKDINLIGCSVSRVFEKYAQLTREQQIAQKEDFEECKKFAKEHRRELVANVRDRHRKISGMLKVYVPNLYLKSLIKRYS